MSATGARIDVTVRRRPRMPALLLAAAVAVAGGTGCSAPTATPPSGTDTSDRTGPSGAPTGVRYPVVSVADGDTITVLVDGVTERVRLIGIDAPELHNPVECFGQESADYATSLLNGTSVELLADPTQDDRDRYGRLLRYVIAPDGTNVNGALVANGYAYEYTYDAPYRYRDVFVADQRAARAGGAGLWSASTCDGQKSGLPPVTPGTAAPQSSAPRSSTAAPGAPAGCAIKGNINAEGVKIYHLPGDDSYNDTVITEGKGERYFCTVADAEAAGWRAAKN